MMAEVEDAATIVGKMIDLLAQAEKNNLKPVCFEVGPRHKRVLLEELRKGAVPRPDECEMLRLMLQRMTAFGVLVEVVERDDVVLKTALDRQR